jgi:hypothetical protein
VEREHRLREKRDARERHQREFLGDYDFHVHGGERVREAWKINSCPYNPSTEIE